MLRFITRTVYTNDTVRRLWQGCALGRPKPQFSPIDGSVTDYGSCWYCRYRDEVTNAETFYKCHQAHSCNEAMYPFIRMSRPVNDEVWHTYPRPGGLTMSYDPTGVFRQVKFEGQPLYVQLYVATLGDGRCNASCWWHAWRLANKRTWRDCGDAHVCQNNSSLWVLMAPAEADLYDEFITGDFSSIDSPDFNEDFNNDFSI